MAFNISDLFSIPGLVGSFDVSPDGKHAAVVWDKTGRWEVYRVALDGKGKPQPITADGASHVSPRYSPDGTRLAFAQDYDGDECFDIFVHDFHSGAMRNLLPNTPEEIVNGGFAWSPDGSEIAFVSNREGRMATFAVTTDGTNRVRRITRHDYSDILVDWSPDGKNLLVTAWTEGQDTGVLVVPASGGASNPVRVDGKLMDAFQASWAADSSSAVFVSNAPGMASVARYFIATGEIEWLVRDRWDAGEPRLAPGMGKLAFTLNEDGNMRLAVMSLKSHRVRFLDIDRGSHLFPHWLDDNRLLIVFDSARRPNDLWLIDLRRDTRRQVTHSLPKPWKPAQFVAPKTVRWKSDDYTISGLLFKPKNSNGKRLPAVVLPHGGPTAQSINFWYPQIQHLVSEGYIVLCPNYRGSTGYGRAFQEANRFDMGGGDMRDVIRGAEYLVKRGLADPKRIAISGVSYGGYLTMTALVKHPRVFAAGSAVVPFLNWFTEFANEREDLRYWDERNFGHPDRDPQRFREYSPIYYMENIVAPVQMIAGAHDPRCPAEETEQAAEALKEMGVPHEVIIFPDEGHGFRKTENKIRAYQARSAFLEKYLRKERRAKSQKRG